MVTNSYTEGVSLATCTTTHIARYSCWLYITIAIYIALNDNNLVIAIHNYIWHAHIYMHMLAGSPNTEKY